jgi:hypothetical protein
MSSFGSNSDFGASDREVRFTPRERTCSDYSGMSEMCHEQTFGIQYFHALQAGCYSHLLIHRNEAPRQRCYRVKRCREGRSRDCEDARI